VRVGTKGGSFAIEVEKPRRAPIKHKKEKVAA